MRISDKQKEILKTIGICAVLAGALIAPNIIQLLKPLNNREKYQYKKSLKKLIKNDVIFLFGEEIELTSKGKDLIKRIQLEEIDINRPEKWDGNWHLVCYDIPEDKKQLRDYFRKKLVDLGFKVIQDSLWVIPYECKEEIAVISQNLGISPYVAYLNTIYLPNQDKLIKYFSLQDNIDEISN